MAAETTAAPPAGPSAATVPTQPHRRSLARRLLADRGGAVGLVILALVVCAALFAPFLAPHDPLAQDIEAKLRPPFWVGGTLENPLGTDPLGRDLLSRILFGTRVSLLIACAAILIQGFIGTALGLASGYFGGVVDAVIMRVADTQLTIPFIVLALAVMTVLGRSLENIVVVLGITGWVFYGRVVRSQVLSLKEREFVYASRVLGAGGGRIILRHLLPNVLPAVVVIASLQVPAMITAEAALSYLGVGVQPPTPAWGSMVADGRDYIYRGWWVSTLPGLALTIAVLGINLLGNWLRDVVDAPAG